MNKIRILYKNIIVFMLLFFLGNKVFSQNFIAGIQFGGTSSSVRGFENENEYESAIAFTGGLSLEYKIKEKLSLVLNVSYERKSVNRSIRLLDPFLGSFTEFTNDIEHNYITIPLMIKYNFFSKKKFNIYASTGPYVGMLLNVVNNNFDLERQGFKNAEFGFVGGLGVDFQLYKNYSLFMEFRDNLGLTNISSIPVDISGGQVKTNTLNLLIGFKHRF